MSKSQSTNKKKIRIGIVLSNVPVYSETFFRNKIVSLQQSGFEVVLFVDYPREIDEKMTVSIKYAFNFNSGGFRNLIAGLKSLTYVLFKNPLRSFKLYRLDREDGVSAPRALKNVIAHQMILSENLDWLHFGYGMLVQGRENLAKAIGAQMAVSFRGADLYLSPIKHPNCYKVLMKKRVKYHVLSMNMKEILVQNYGIREDHIGVIHPAIDTDRFYNDKIKSICNPIEIITVARLHWVKGLEYTLQALAIVKEKGISFNFSIIGDGDELERLSFAVYQLGLENHVVFEGRVEPEQVRHRLSESDIYLQYSIQEGFCNSVLEAQAMGLLCLVSDAGGLPENVVDKQTGFVVPRRKPDVLAAKIAAIAQMPVLSNIEIRKKAIERVKNEFNLEIQTKRFVRFYE